MSWFKNPWLENNPWAQGTEEYPKWHPNTSSQNDLELVSKPKTMQPFHVAFSTSANYKGEYGFDTWTKEKDKLLTHVTYQDKRLTKDEYRNLAKEKVPTPYKNHVEGTCFLCLKPGVRADLEMSIESDKAKPIFEEGDMFYIAAHSELKNLVLLTGNSILNTVELPVNNNMDLHHMLYPIKASNTPSAISIVLKDSLNPSEKQYISSDIPLTVYFKKKNNSEFNEVGKIVFMANKPIIVPVRLVVFKKPPFAEPEWYINIMKDTSDLLKNLVPKTFTQACIELTAEKGFIKIDIDDSFNPYFSQGILTPLRIESNSLDEFENEVDGEGKVVKFKKIADKFFDFYQKYAKNVRHESHPFRGIIVMLTPFELQSAGNNKVAGEGMSIPKNAQHCILYGKTMGNTEQNNYTVYHELSHIFGLLHTFIDNAIQPLIDRIGETETELTKDREAIDELRSKQSISQSEIKQVKDFDTKLRFLNLDKERLEIELNRSLFFTQYQTSNVMDYTNGGNSNPLRTYYFWQWKIMRDEAKNYYST